MRSLRYRSPHLSLRRVALGALLMGVLSLPLQAAISVNTLFSDDMVLQRSVPIHIWGTGSNGESVSATFDGKSASATVQNGKWSLTLPAMEASSQGRNLVVGTKTFKNVLVGDVWLLSGQSNMEIGLKAPSASDLEYIKSATIRGFRINAVRSNIVSSPQDNVPYQWQWKSPTESVSSMSNFSAVGQYFGSRVNKETGVPIGLIHAAFGGSKIFAWTPQEILEASDTGRAIIDFHSKNVSNQEHDHPAVLYDTYIHPMTPLAIAGYIWYQGEADSKEWLSERYEWNCNKLIKVMRERFTYAVKDFPVILIQVHPWIDAQAGYGTPGESDRAIVRQAQYNSSRANANTGIINILDIGEKNIHPADKKTPGTRAANYALARWYGKSVQGAECPWLSSMSRKGNRVVIHYDQNGTGLKTTDNQPPRSFIVRQKATDKWTRADAQIVGNTVEIWSSTVATINEVRYAWEDLPSVNLVNQYGQPVGQFSANSFGPTATQRPGSPSLRASALPALTQELFDIRGRRVQSSLSHSLPTAAGVYIRPDGSRMVTASQP